MRIPDLIATARRPLCSFEFFPPKDDAGEAQLWSALAKLQPLRPDFVSVTYGANGSTRDRTIAVTTSLVERTGLNTMGHLTCVGQSVAEVRGVLDRYAAAGVDHIFAIRGDMPGGPTVPWVPHPAGLATATQLVELIRASGDFAIGVAAFPDPHPAQSDSALDARILKDKWSAGADFAITQLFFDARAYVALVERVRALGCPIPIIPGIMPITAVSQVVRFAGLSGAALPYAVTARLEAVAHDPEAVKATGQAIATELAQELLALGAPGLHFFTQNRSAATRAIWSAVGGPAAAA